MFCRRASSIAFFPMLATLAMVTACSRFGPVGAIRQPSWMADAQRTSPVLTVIQSAGFDGQQIRLCRRLRNVGQRPAVIRKLPAEGNGYDELNVHFFDRDGDWIEPERHARLTATVFEHPMLIPPPPPRSADDISIYSVLAPGEQFENCHRYDLPPGHALFQAQTSYWPTLSEDLVPERLKDGNVIVSRDAVGILLSQPCVIDVRRRRTDCVVRD